MSATLAIRHERRDVVATRPWAGPARPHAAPEASPAVRHVGRTVGDPGPGTEIEVVEEVHRPLVMVARLWLGVLSMFVLIVCLGLVGMTLGAWALGYRPVVVTSGSMGPGIRQGDVVITRDVDPGERLGVQTVIDFEDPDGSGTRLHRIVEVTPSGYRTKGDANPTTDSAMVPRSAVRGAGLVLAPFAGYLPLWLDQGRWVHVALAFAALAAVATMSRRSWMWARGAPA